MEKETFDYSKVPYCFGLCAAEDCSRANTCLRRVAYNHVPADVPFTSMLNPKAVEAMKGECEYYLPNVKVRYAKGFVRTARALSVNASGTFRCSLINLWGIRRYYQMRKGEVLLSPAEQQQVIALAKKLGAHQEEYFDAYVEEYSWT